MAEREHTARPLVAPWDDETVDALNKHQGRSDRHPFTCPADGTKGSNKHTDRRILRATPEGWVCDFNDCGFVQTWAHFHMAKEAP